MSEAPPVTQSPDSDVVNEENAEDFYFKYAVAQDALSRKRVLGIDPGLIDSWTEVLSRRWPELAPMASCAQVEEIAARLAFSNLTPEHVATLNPPDLAASCGVSLTDAVVVINILRFESVGDVHKRRVMVPTIRATSHYHPQISDLNFVDPHTPNENITKSAVNSIGPRAAIQDSDTVHGLIAFVVTLFIWSEFPFVDKQQVSAAADTIELIVVATWILSLFCAITVSIATLAAKDSDYTACNFLAIPYAVRYVDGWLFILSLLLSIVRAALILNESESRWKFAVFVPVNLAMLALAATFALIMFMRVSTSTRVPKKQWFRWFPCGSSYTRKSVSSLLMHSGNFAKREYQKELRSAVCAAMAKLAFQEPKSDVRFSSPLTAMDDTPLPPRRPRVVVAPPAAPSAGGDSTRAGLLLSPDAAIRVARVPIRGVSMPPPISPRAIASPPQ